MPRASHGVPLVALATSDERDQVGSGARWLAPGWDVKASPSIIGSKPSVRVQATGPVARIIRARPLDAAVALQARIRNTRDVDGRALSTAAVLEKHVLSAGVRKRVTETQPLTQTREDRPVGLCRARWGHECRQI